MYRILIVSFIVLNVIHLRGETASLSEQKNEGEEDYASYANLYNEIAKKIGEEPIEIIDVVKSVVVYDSDDDAMSHPEPITPGSPPEPTDGKSTVELF